MSLEEKKRNRRGLWLCAIVAGMLGFAFLNVPLFRVFCRHIGLSVPSSRDVIVPAGPIDRGRSIDVSFTGVAAKGLYVSLAPRDPLETVHLGERTVNAYTFTNLTDEPVRFRAIHDIYPGDAAEHFAMIQCFCFTDQTLAPHESKTLPVIYQVNTGISGDVERVSVIYTLEPLAPGGAGQP